MDTTTRTLSLSFCDKVSDFPPCWVWEMTTRDKHGVMSTVCDTLYSAGELKDLLNSADVLPCAAKVAAAMAAQPAE